MKIENVKLKNFRSYTSFEIDPEKLNIIKGKNAQGKTNLIEAVYFCAIGKSFRTSKEKELIKWKKEFSKIEINLKKKYRKVKIEVFLTKIGKKTIKIDGIPIKRIGELLGNLNIIFFSPDELSLIKDSPFERRKFMDIDISQGDKRYFYLISKYDKILEHRNKLLKETKTFEALKETVDIWDRQISQVAAKIIFERQKFIYELAPYANLACKYITDNAENLNLEYIGERGDSEKEIEEKLLKKLEKNLEKDYKLGYTTVGPHRDEINIYLNEVEVKSFGSQGQQKTAALCMKLAELEIMEKRTGEVPVLLLDDVFSELDEDRRNKLIKFTSKAQTFITCTEFNFKNIEAKEFIIKKDTNENGR